MALPATSAVTIPVEALMVKTPMSLLCHVPPVVVLVSVQDAPSHTSELPLMGAGSAFTVTLSVLKQPVAKV